MPDIGILRPVGVLVMGTTQQGRCSRIRAHVVIMDCHFTYLGSRFMLMCYTALLLQCTWCRSVHVQLPALSDV
jgi:hypothetical protein